MKYSIRRHDSVSATDKNQLYFYTHVETPFLKRYHLNCVKVPINTNKDVHNF